MNSRARVEASMTMMMMIPMIYRIHCHRPKQNDQVCFEFFSYHISFSLYFLFLNHTVSSAFAFITAFISGILVSMTLRLYKLSRNYRYVTRVLSKEKKALKQEKDFGQGHRIGAGRVWAPMPSVLRTQG